MKTKKLYIIGDFSEGYALATTETKSEAKEEYKEELKSNSCGVATHCLEIPTSRAYSIDFGEFTLTDENGDIIGLPDTAVKITEIETLADYLKGYNICEHYELLGLIQNYFEEIRGDIIYMSDLADFEEIAEDREDRHDLKIEGKESEKY